MKTDGIDREVLEQYVQMRRDVTKRVDRIVGVVHLLNLLKHCDGEIEVSPMALAVVADLVDADVTSINEMLDDFIYVVDAEEVLAR